MILSFVFDIELLKKDIRIPLAAATANFAQQK
ncbi:hypothetical protein G3A_12815 [Bacillus sp. 17376]|nr:hypothetical protein G3A_12815 [Bacillus sp. 17376]